MKIFPRYLSPKNRHFVLLAAKVHRTVCLSAHDPFSERGLAIASLKTISLFNRFPDFRPLAVTAKVLAFSRLRQMPAAIRLQA